MMAESQIAQRMLWTCFTPSLALRAFLYWAIKVCSQLTRPMPCLLTLCRGYRSGKKKAAICEPHALSLQCLLPLRWSNQLIRTPLLKARQQRSLASNVTKHSAVATGHVRSSALCTATRCTQSLLRNFRISRPLDRLHVSHEHGCSQSARLKLNTATIKRARNSCW